MGPEAPYGAGPSPVWRPQGGAPLGGGVTNGPSNDVHHTGMAAEGKEGGRPLLPMILIAVGVVVVFALGFAVGRFV